jgi:uncharacterized protein YutD
MPTDKNPETEKAPLCPLQRHMTPCCGFGCAWWCVNQCAIKAIAMELAARGECAR